MIDELDMRAALQKRSKGPTGFPAGVTLAEEEHEQKCGPFAEFAKLLVAQLKLDRQRNHGKSLENVGSTANWFMVGFGSYARASAFAGTSMLGYLTTWASAAPGITSSRPKHRPGQGSQFLMSNVKIQQSAKPVCCNDQLGKR